MNETLKSEYETYAEDQNKQPKLKPVLRKTISPELIERVDRLMDKLIPNGRPHNDFLRQYGSFEKMLSIVEKNLAQSQGPSLGDIEQLVAVRVDSKLKELQATVQPVEPDPEVTAETVEDPYNTNGPKEPEVSERNTFVSPASGPTEEDVKQYLPLSEQEPNSIGLEQPHTKKSKEDWVACPTQDDWVDRHVECDLCKTKQPEVYKECVRKRVADPFGPLFHLDKPKPSL